MKNKLLLTTAIVGLGLASVANAQTTVSGNLNIAYKAVGGAAKASSFDGWAKESQINIANKGKLSTVWIMQLEHRLNSMVKTLLAH